MKKLLIVLLILGIGSFCFGETVRVKIRREVPADKEYFQTNDKGNVERVREYKGREVKESFNYEKETGRLVREREVKDAKRDRK
jgi:hypothetical protein